MKSLLHSRKFWLALFALVQTIVLNYYDIPDEIWQAINNLVIVLVGSIAVEDFAAKIRG